MQTIAELKRLPKDRKTAFELVVVVRKIATKRAKNNSEFLMVELGDRSGLFHVVCFENSAEHQVFSDLAVGAIVRVKGATGYYQGRFSPSLSAVALIPADEQHRYAATLVESAPEDLDELWEELKTLAAAIEHEGLRRTVESILEEHGDLFRSTPGAISMHHAYRGGLLEHTVHMARAGRALLPLYPEVHEELERLPKEAVVRRAALSARLEPDLRDRLEHIVLSHQGELEWGAAAKAATPEAVFVSMVDNLDAKMGMIQQALRTTPEGEEFSEFVPGLGAPVLVARPVDRLDLDPADLFGGEEPGSRD
ncbi:MAG: OB-fold nucleic acid binding domain-containing protein [Verrucomicrobiota bacterium]